MKMSDFAAETSLILGVEEEVIVDFLVLYYKITAVEAETIVTKAKEKIKIF